MHQQRHLHYYAGTTQSQSAAQEHHIVEVQVFMPHLAKYDKNTKPILTYGANFAVRPGQPVLCPPTKLYPHWTRGYVRSVDQSNYRGPLKYVTPLKNSR